MYSSYRVLKRRRLFLALLCALALIAPSLTRVAHTQEPAASPTQATQSVNRPQLHQALLDLANPFTVMCVAAHPDDEDGTTLTVLRRKHGVHTVSLFSTFGEGGQNAVGPELYEQLGVIRAEETRKAAVIQGSEPYFLGMKDFGFSKSAEETFKIWAHDEALGRMVLKIRELRPDVIITNHNTARGHGHHQATGQLLIEAFDAAADPKRFPEQLVQLKPWQPQRLFVRMFGGGSAVQSAGSEKVVTVDPNEVDPVRGIPFAEQALKALQQHATQGPWPKSMADMLRARRVESGKLPLIRYQLARAASDAPPLDKLDAASPPFLAGLKTPQSLSQKRVPFMIDDRAVTEIIAQPASVLDALIKRRMSNLASESAAEDLYRVGLLEASLDKAIALAAGVSLTLGSSDSVLVPGTKTTFALNLANAGDKPILIKRLSLNSWGEQSPPLNTAEQLPADSETGSSVERTTPTTAAITVPKEDHLYDGSVSGQSFVAEAELEIEGARFLVSAEKNLDVVPAVEIERILPSPCVRTEEMLGGCALFNVTLKNHLPVPFRGLVKISSRFRGHIREGTYQLVLAPRETRSEKLSDRNPIPPREALPGLRSSGSVVFSVHRLDASAPITERTVPVVFSKAVAVPNLKVGYVPSFDETLERSMAALGVESKSLSVGDVQNADLSSYNTIIIDNRGYEAHPELIAANSRLLDFANAGGTLIVFYHKDNEWNPDPAKKRPQLAPYPIVLGGERVTDETAPIIFTQPRHPLLNYPNKIRAADFKNWIQERGLYYPKEWDAHYTTLFSTNDADEKPLKGGLLVAKYGKGNYIYTSMVWYRQLRGGVPGAYRMFANMLSYGQRNSAHQRKSPSQKKLIPLSGAP